MIDFKKYLGIAYDYDTFNCITLVKHFYKQELQIDIGLPDYGGPKIWYTEYTHNNIDEVLKNYAVKIPLTAVKDYDLIVFGNKKRLTHFGIYIAPGRLLHIERNSVTKLDHLTSAHISKVVGVYRHYDLV